MGADVVYPTTRIVDQNDDFHGTLVNDPYRWLEGDVRTEPEVAAWVAAQNQVTNDYLSRIPFRGRLRERLAQLWNYPRYSPPIPVNGGYAYFKNDGLQNQAVLYWQASLQSVPEVLIDPNHWSADGTIALAGTRFSDDGSHLAYAIQEAGSDWHSWRVMDVRTKEVLPNELRWIKFNSPVWLKDGSGLIYARYPQPTATGEFQSLNLHQKVYLHRLGTTQSEDELLFEQPDHPDWGFSCQVSDEGEFLVITAWVGTDDRYRVFIKSLTDRSQPARHLIGEFDAEYSFLGNDKDVLYFRTTNQAPRRRIVAISRSQPQPEHWREIVAEQADVIEDVELIGDVLIITRLHHAASLVTLHDLGGQELSTLPLPGLGTATGFRGKRTDRETFYSFSSFAVPPSIYRLDLTTKSVALWRKSEIDLSLEPFETQQIFATSRDGTRVPMFVTRRRDLPRDGRQPTLLYGYGGFNVSLTPSFSITRAMWLEMGGTLAVANLRGGGEYGEEWHRSGTKSRKQNVFDDFIACAEYLIAQRFTDADHLAIQGGSNGGLLVGACLTQRPELFRAALPAVGVMDMLRFQKFTAGRFWVDDYGSADNPEEFPALHAYSPYHRLQPGRQYPATLVTTADTDDRVVPGHSFKFAARLQACQAGPAPTLIRIETRAGHGAGKPTAKLIEEAADQLSFLVQELGMSPALP